MIKVLEDFHHFPYISIHLSAIKQLVTFNVHCTMYEIYKYLIQYILSHYLYFGTLITKKHYKKSKQIKKYKKKVLSVKLDICDYHIWVIEGYASI